MRSLLIRFDFLLLSFDGEVVKFSEELLLPELASDEVRLRTALLKFAAPMISSSLTSDSGDVVRYDSSRISVNLDAILLVRVSEVSTLVTDVTVDRKSVV